MNDGGINNVKVIEENDKGARDRLGSSPGPSTVSPSKPFFTQSKSIVFDVRAALSNRKP